MKKVILGMATLAFLFTSCENDQNGSLQEEQTQVDMSDFYVHTESAADEAFRKAEGKSKSCYTMVRLNEMLNSNPGLEKKMYNIEYHTRKILAKKPDGAGNGNGNGNGGGGDTGGGDTGNDNLGVITIPVYVHVIYSNSNENISDQQINSQITVLNRDFRRSNSDANETPSEFADVAADSEIEFVLAGVTRKSTTRTSWGTNDAMKFNSNGGVDVVSPSTALNIWVCNIGGGILGYAQFPGGPSATDGVVVGPQFFGSQGYVASPFDEGRTTTHEVGHYLNLRHIWGDGRCRQDDFVSDTPSSDGPNYGCPASAYNCRSNDQFMNYMDYTDDGCMNMFSEGQKSRMRALFASGGAREALLP